jgi:hypothetical protein
MFADKVQMLMLINEHLSLTQQLTIGYLYYAMKHYDKGLYSVRKLGAGDFTAQFRKKQHSSGKNPVIFYIYIDR